MKLIEKKAFIIGNIFIFTQAFLNIYLIPLKEFPDAIHHLNQIMNKSKFNFYYNIQSMIVLKKVNLHDSILNPLFFQGGNQSLYKYSEFKTSEFFLGQVFNLLILGGFIFIFCMIVSSDKNIELKVKQKIIRLTILFFSWPQINYYITNLSSDFFIILYQPLFIYFVIKKKRIQNFVLMLLLLKFVDNNIFVNIIFFLVYFMIEILFLKKEYLRIKKYKLFILSLIGLAIIYILINSNLLQTYFPEIYIHKEFNYSVGSRSWIRRIGALIISSLYLSGSGAYMLPLFFYLFYIFILTKIIINILISKDKNKEQLFLFMLTSFVSIGITLIIIPTLGQVKYYTFIIFFIIEGINRVIFKSGNIITNKIYLKILYLNLSMTLFMGLKIVRNIYF